MTWTRRTVLRAFASAPAATALAACGGRDGRKRTGPESDSGAGDDPRSVLREIIGDLEVIYPIATGLLTVRRLGGAAVDPGEQGVNVEASTEAVLRVFDGERWFESVTTDVSEDALGAARDALRAAAGAPSLRPGARAARTTAKFSTALGRDPSEGSLTDWLGVAGVLYDRARTVGGSRIVYRGAYVTVDDARTVFIGDGRELSSRVVRTRAGVLFVASTGSATTSEEASHAITGDLSAANISPDEMESATDRALEALTARPAPGGDVEIIIDPSVTALFAEQCLAPALSAPAWVTGGSKLGQSIGAALGSPLVSLSDDATLDGELGTYYFDDEGWAPKRVDLIDRGTLVAGLTDRASASALGLARTGHARRTGSGTSAVASNLLIASGEADLSSMIEDVKDGLLVEGGVVARSDPRTLRFAARGARAKEIKAGRETGRLYGDVDIVGAIPDLLKSTRMISSQVTRVIGRHGAPRSIIAPFLLSRATVAKG